MKKTYIILFLILLSSCSKRDVFLPKTNSTVLISVEDFSPIYMFFDTNERDTVIDVNKKNLISTTNWVFNVDKRLPLRLVLPEVMKMQEKRNKDGMHKKEDAQHYFSYSNDSIKELAFLPFTNVKYLNKALDGNASYNNIVIRRIADKDSLFINSTPINKNDFLKRLKSIAMTDKNTFALCFDKDCSFDSYVLLKVAIAVSKTKVSNEEVFLLKSIQTSTNRDKRIKVKLFILNIWIYKY